MFYGNKILGNFTAITSNGKCEPDKNQLLGLLETPACPSSSRLTLDMPTCEAVLRTDVLPITVVHKLSEMN